MTFALFLGIQLAPEVGPTSYETPCITMCYTFRSGIEKWISHRKRLLEKKGRLEASFVELGN